MTHTHTVCHPSISLLTCKRFDYYTYFSFSRFDVWVSPYLSVASCSSDVRARADFSQNRIFLAASVILIYSEGETDDISMCMHGVFIRCPRPHPHQAVNESHPPLIAKSQSAKQNIL